MTAPTSTGRAALKAARAAMRYPTDHEAAENVNLRDLVEEAVAKKLAEMRATGCHHTPTTIPGD